MHPDVLRTLTQELWTLLELPTLPSEDRPTRPVTGYVGTVLVDGRRRGALELHLSEPLARTAVSALRGGSAALDDTALFDGVSDLLGIVVAAVRRRLPGCRMSDPVVALSNDAGRGLGPHAARFRSQGELLVVAWKGALA